MIHNWIFFRKGKHCWQHLLKPGYGHIFIIARDDYNWVLIDPLFSFLSIKILNYNIKENVVEKIKSGYEVSDCFYIKLKDVPYKSHFKLNIFNPINCVGAIKYYLGIKKWYIITPYQLVRYLLQKRYFADTNILECRRDKMGAQETAQVSPEQEELESEQKRKARDLMNLRLQILRRQRGGAGITGGTDQTLG